MILGKEEKREKVSAADALTVLALDFGNTGNVASTKGVCVTKKDKDDKEAEKKRRRLKGSHCQVD